MMDENAILNAACCPVCLQPPIMIVDDAIYPTLDKTKDYILRCHEGHPYVACGDNPTMAVAMWNQHIAFRQRDFHHNQSAFDPKNTQLTYCPHCKQHTSSKLTFEDTKSMAECNGCHLFKSIKESA